MRDEGTGADVVADADDVVGFGCGAAGCDAGAGAG